MESREAYYAYYDELYKKYYYYCTKTKQTQWIYPPDAIVVRNDTLKYFKNPNDNDESMSPIKIAHKRRETYFESVIAPKKLDNFDGLLIDIPDQIKNFVPPQSPSKAPSLSGIPKPPSKDKLSSADEIKKEEEKEEITYLPTTIQEDIHKFKIERFAKNYFQRHAQKCFVRTSISTESLVNFEAKPIKQPLLKSLNDKVHKDALKCFQYILRYAGVGCKISTSAPIKLVHLVSEKPELRDEVYFQLIKQTNNVPERTWSIAFWDLFLIMATIFPSTLNSENWIKSHIAKAAQSAENKEVSVIAQFTYIRFSSRCCIGCELKGYDDNYILEIPSHPFSSNLIFGVSLYEVMWGQRRYFPNCPIPIFMHKCAEAIIAKGGMKSQGIFRLSGSMRRVEEMTNAANLGEDVLQGPELNDLASFFKKWVREIPETLVPPLYEEAYNDANDGTHRIIEFVNSLPKLYKCSLGYLVGFLQKIAIAVDETKMTATNLAIVFAPNVIQYKSDMMRDSSSNSRTFLTYLLENWDVSFVYPLKV